MFLKIAYNVSRLDVSYGKAKRFLSGEDNVFREKNVGAKKIK
jgi:hypothetical protein